MTTPDIDRLRVEVTDPVDPHLLVAALRGRLAGRPLAGAEDHAARAIIDAVRAAETVESAAPVGAEPARGGHRWS